jgi:hypothetical protein
MINIQVHLKLMFNLFGYKIIYKKYLVFLQI